MSAQLSKLPAKSRSRSTKSYQLRVELKGVKPAVWRRIAVPSTIKLSKLHHILLAVRTTEPLARPAACMNSAFLQPSMANRHEALSIPRQSFDDVAAPPPKYEDVPARDRVHNVYDFATRLPAPGQIHGASSVSPAAMPDRVNWQSVSCA
jgi:hypothetical protein